MSATLTDPKEIIQIIFGGKSIFTLHSTVSDTSYTYMVEEGDKRNPNDPKEIPLYFVKLLTGPDNLTSYTYVGAIFGRRNFRLTKNSKLTMEAPSVIAFDRSLRAIFASAGSIPPALEFIPSTRCARCGRTLTVTASCKVGFGPECAEIVGVGYSVPTVRIKHDKPLTNFKKHISKYTPVSGPTTVVVGEQAAAQLDDARYARIKKFNDENEDAGDAKFLALAEEAGITVEDLEWFSHRQKDDPDYNDVKQTSATKTLTEDDILAKYSKIQLRLGAL